MATCSLLNLFSGRSVEKTVRYVNNTAGKCTSRFGLSPFRFFADFIDHVAPTTRLSCTSAFVTLSRPRIDMNVALEPRYNKCVHLIRDNIFGFSITPVFTHLCEHLFGDEHSFANGWYTDIAACVQ